MPENRESQGAGRLSLFKHTWRQVTSNSFVLNIIEFGYKLQFFKIPPLKIIKSGKFSSLRISSVSKELSILYSKKLLFPPLHHLISLYLQFLTYQRKTLINGELY